MGLHLAHVPAARAADHLDDLALKLFARLLGVDEDFDAVASKRQPGAALANVDVVQTGSAHHVRGSARGEFNGARGIGQLHFEAEPVAVCLNLVGAAQNFECAGDERLAGPFVHTRFKRQVGGRELAPWALLKKTKQAVGQRNRVHRAVGLVNLGSFFGHLCGILCYLSQRLSKGRTILRGRCNLCVKVSIFFTDSAPN